MTKRRNGAGSIEVLRDGRARVRVFVDGRRRTIGTFESEEIAARMLRAWNAERDAGVIVAPGALTLGALGRDWLDQRELLGSRVRARVADIRNERQNWRHHVEAHELATMAVQSIRPRDVDAFALWLRAREAVAPIRTANGPLLRPTGRTIAVQTQRNVVRLVRQVLDEAVRRELIATNPAALVVVASAGAPARDLSEDWLRPGELEQLLEADSIPLRDRTAYAAAVGLALRLDDLKAIAVDDVRLDVAVPGPHVRVVVSKTQKRHNVPVLPWLEPWLRAHLEALPAGARWLFPSPSGEPYGESYDFGWARKSERVAGELRHRPSALERAGVERRIRFHDLRGTCATLLAIGAWGRRWSLHEIQGMLAHADQKTTERYVRRALNALATAAQETAAGPRLPAVAQGGSDAIDGSALISGAPGVSRTRDLRFRNAGLEAVVSPGSATVGQGAGNAAAIARRVIDAVAAGDVPAALLAELAGVVLERDDVRLALEVRAGGEHAVRRAIELAALLASAAAATSSRASS